MTQHAFSVISLMKLMWLGSPTLPVGGFSYSEGMEMAVELGLVHDEASALEWLLDQMHLNQARGDWSLLAQAVEVWQHFDQDQTRQTITELNSWVLMTRESSEFRQQTLQMGRSLLTWLNANDRAQDPRVVLCNGFEEPTWPLIYALALAMSTTDLSLAVASHAFGWAENMVQTAMKTIPLGQLSGQRLLNAMLVEIPQAVEFAIQLPEKDRQVFTPGLAILSAQHEDQYSRLFRS